MGDFVGVGLQLFQSKMKRCVNIDWLEVYCLEIVSDHDSRPRDARFFENYGYKVVARDYGTPQYKEMFTIFGSDGREFLEIRRAPYSVKSSGGIFPDNACHIRLSNRACYAPAAVDNLRKFLLAFNYTFMGISRVDICADFPRFDDGSDPKEFIRRYMAGQLHKLGLSRVHAYGVDFEPSSLVVQDARGRVVKNPKIMHRGHVVAVHGKDGLFEHVFNSIKWGAPSSRVSVKLYDKTQEMREVKPKFHIQDAWRAAGFGGEKTIWRLEFSVSSDAKNWVNNEDGEVFELNLHSIDTPDNLNRMFNILCARYFRFAQQILTRNGTPMRKDRCPVINPIDTNRVDVFYPVNLSLNREPNRTDKILVKRLEAIVKNEDNIRATMTEREAARQLLMYFKREMRFNTPYVSKLFDLSNQSAYKLPE